MVDFQIGCFGKLPIYADFIRLHAESKEVRDLDQWFQEGIHSAKAKLGRGWEEDFSKADRWHFVFHTGGGYFLIGTYLPSKDKAGRRYPFFLFLRMERSRFGLSLNLAPFYFSKLLAEFSEVSRTGWRNKDLRSFLSTVGGITFPLHELAPAEELYRDRLRRQTMGGVWTGLLPGGAGDGRYHVVENLIKLVEPLRHQGVPRFGVGLKCPIGEEARFDIAFWLDLIFRILKQDKVDPVFFWNDQSPSGKAAGRGTMMLFLNLPSPRHFLFQIRPDLKGESLYDLTSDERIERGISHDQRILLERDELSPEEFLEGMEKWV